MELCIMDKLELNKELHIFVTNVEAEDDTYLKIWGQLDTNAVVRMEILLSSLEEYFTSSRSLAGLSTVNLRTNTVCCAKLENAGYYRAKILNIQADGKVVLRFIDYGTIEVLPPQDVHLLENIRSSESFHSYPPLAYDFTLMDVLPRNMVWDKKMIESIKFSLWQQEHKIVIHSIINNYRFIKLQYNNENFGNILVKCQMAVPATLQDLLSLQGKRQAPLYQHPNKRVVSNNNSTSMTQTQNVLVNPTHCDGNTGYQHNVTPCCNVQQKHLDSTPTVQEALVFKSRVLDVGSKHEVYVSFVEDGPHKFSVQVQSTSQILTMLMRDINSHPVEPLQEPPLPGSVCMGRYTQDKVLCRAVVMSVMENKCKLYYVDFGHTEVLPYTDIYQLPPHYINPKVLSIRFTLSGVKELNVTEEMKEYFKNIVSAKLLMLHVRPPEGPPLVQYGDLYDNGKNIKDILRQAFPAPAAPPAPSFIVYQEPRVLTKGMEEAVYVSFIESCNKFFIQLDSCSKTLESVMNCLAEYCKTAPPINPVQMRLGLPCAALYENQWYRAQILNINGDNIKVLYVDYGNEETVNIVSLRVIHNDFVRKLQAQAIKCILNGWERLQHIKDVKIQFELLTLEKRCLLKVVDVHADGNVVDLYDPENMKDIKSQLLQTSSNVNAVNFISHYKSDETSQHTSKTNNAKASTSDTTNKWQKKSPPEAWHRVEDNPPMYEKPKMKSFKDDFNEERRHNNKSDKSSAYRSDFRSDRPNRDDTQSNIKNTREKWNNKYDQGDSPPFNRSGRSPRGGKMRTSGNSFTQNHSSASEKSFSDKDSDVSSRSNSRRGRAQGSSTRGGFSKRDGSSSEMQGGRWSSGDNDGGGYRSGKGNSDFYNASDKYKERKSQGYRIARNKASLHNSFGLDNSEGDRRNDISQNRNEFHPVANTVAIGGIKTCIATTVNNPSDFYLELKNESPPAQTLHCKLYGINNTNISERDIKLFTSKVMGKTLEAEFVNENFGVYEVLLKDITVGSSSSTYINEDFDKVNEIVKVKNESRNRGKAAGSTKPSVQYDYAPAHIKWSTFSYNLGIKQNVIITWIINPNNFFCQVLDRESEFCSMMNEMQKMYSGRDPISHMIQAGAPVVAEFADDGALYRAEIIEPNKPGGHLVQYIDFGNTTVVPPQKVYPVENKLLQLPKLAVRCTLKNIVPLKGTTWAKTKTQEIDNCFNAEKYECTFHDIQDDKYVISLSNNGNDVGDILVSRNLAAYSESESKTIEKELPSTKMAVSNNIQKMDITLLSGQTVRVKVSSVESASKFYIQLPSATESDNIVNSYMADKNPAVMQRLSTREMCLGTGCLICTNGVWRRAVIIGPSNDTGFDVKLIDTGEKDEILSSSVLALPGELSVMQNQAIECTLRNATSDSEKNRKLAELINGKEVLLYIEEVDNNRLITKIFDLLGNKINLFNEASENICPICPMPILSSTHKVTVSFADHSASVWLQRSSDNILDSNLNQALQQYYSNNGVKLEAEIGSLCAAKSADGNWYRSKIIACTGEKVFVNFIDYGNNEEVAVNSLMVLDPQFYTPYQLAICVSLPVTLNCPKSEQVNILQTHLSNKEFTAVFYNVNNRWTVELLYEGEKMSEKMRSVNAEMEQQSLTKSPADIENLVPGCKYEVYISHIDSPSQFWIQCVDQVAELNQKQEELQAQSSTFPVVDGFLEEGSLCISTYSIDDLWYRAQVLDADDEITTLRFIDYGNTDVIDSKSGNIRHISDSWKELKIYAAKARLDIAPIDSEDWNEDICTKFQHLVDSAESVQALVIANSSPKRIDLLINGKSVSEMLVEEKVAVMVQSEEALIDEIIDLELDPHSAFVSHINSPNEFWIQEEKSVSDLETMTDRFMVADMFSKIDEIKDGMLCVAKYPEDRQWYRARINSHDENSTRVLYIDYGNSATCTEIRAIPEDLANVPPLSRKCCLSTPDGISEWSEKACDEFIQLSADGATIFILDVIEEGETSLVKLTLDGQSVTDILAQYCNRYPPITEERLPPLGEENLPNVIISRINSIEEFWVQTESDLTELDVMADRLLAAADFPPLTVFDVDTICAAKFSEDGLWYRARILSHSESGTEIIFIDFGNCDVTTELRKLPEDILNISPLARRCTLQKPDKIDVWPPEAVNKLEELAMDESALYQLEILDANDPSLVKLSLNGQNISDILISYCERRALAIESQADSNAESDVKPDNENILESVTDSDLVPELADEDHNLEAIAHEDNFSENKEQTVEDKIKTLPDQERTDTGEELEHQNINLDISQITETSKTIKSNNERLADDFPDQETSCKNVVKELTVDDIIQSMERNEDNELDEPEVLPINPVYESGESEMKECVTDSINVSKTDFRDYSDTLSTAKGSTDAVLNDKENKDDQLESSVNASEQDVESLVDEKGLNTTGTSEEASTADSKHSSDELTVSKEKEETKVISDLADSTLVCDSSISNESEDRTIKESIPLEDSTNTINTEDLPELETSKEQESEPGVVEEQTLGSEAKKSEKAELEVPEPAAPEAVAPESVVPELVALEPVAPKSIAPEPAAPEPVAPEPVAPEPVAPEPVAPEPVAPEPVAPEPVAPEPVAPEPVAPEPVAQEPVAPEPVAPEPVAPEPVAPESPAPKPAAPESVAPEPPAPEPVAPEKRAAPEPVAPEPVAPEKRAAPEPVAPEKRAAPEPVAPEKRAAPEPVAPQPAATELEAPESATDDRTQSSCEDKSNETKQELTESISAEIIISETTEINSNNRKDKDLTQCEKDGEDVIKTA